MCSRKVQDRSGWNSCIMIFMLRLTSEFIGFLGACMATCINMHAPHYDHKGTASAGTMQAGPVLKPWEPVPDHNAAMLQLLDVLVLPS